MPSFSSLTNRQWIVLLALLALNLVCLYGGIIPLALGIAPTTARQAVTTVHGELAEMARVPVDSSPTLAAPVATPSATAPATTSTPAALPISTLTPPLTRTATDVMPSLTPPRTLAPATRPVPPTPSTRLPTRAPAALSLAPRRLAALELDPRVKLAAKTTFFTSACFGLDANLLQDRDFMAPADWSSSPDRKCIFGYRKDPSVEIPAGRYAVFGGPEGQPHFYIVPPDAFAADQQSLKQLSLVRLTVDPEHGCGALGSIGFTADGITYQCPACDLLRPGGACAGGDGSKQLVLPSGRSHVLDAADNGGAIGFVNYPAVIFRKGFSVYFTGKAGYAPPRTYFESAVETLRPEVMAKTTAQMTADEVQELAAPFGGSVQSGLVNAIVALEMDASSSPSGKIVVKPREERWQRFETTPGAVLSSIAWTVKPANNRENKAFMETNLCLEIDGEDICFTGVEDFANCAFYSPCVTGYSSLVGTDNSGFVATRYFAAGAAPVLKDGRLTAKVRGPDIGTVLDIELKVRVRTPTSILTRSQ